MTVLPDTAPPRSRPAQRLATMRKTLLIALCLLFPLTLHAQAAPAPNATTPLRPLPEVVLQTSEGDITLELFINKSPKSVANFLQYVQSGFYDGTVFQRVIKGYLIQGGQYTRQLVAKRTSDPVDAESNNGLSNLRGTVAVARGAAPNSGTSQFFINLVDNRRLDYVNGKSGLTWGYTVFGKVIDGMDVVDKIGNLPTHAQGPFTADVPQPLVVIESARVIGERPASASSTTQPPATTKKKH